MLTPVLAAVLSMSTSVVPGTTRHAGTASTDDRAVRDRLADVVNVKDFGARGDGLTDDTSAIQSAIEAGGQVVVPPGTYRISGSGLSLPGDRALIGAGSGTTVLSYTGDGSAVTLHDAHNRLEGVRITTTSAAAAGVFLSDAQVSTVRDIAVDGNPAVGVHLGSVSNVPNARGYASTMFNEVSNVDVLSAVTPLLLDSTGPGWTNANTIRRATLRTSAAADGTVAVLTSSADGSVSGNSFYDIDASDYGAGTATAWRVDAGCYGNTWYGGYIDSGTPVGFRLAAGVRGLAVFGMVNQATTQVVDGGGNSTVFSWYLGGGPGQTPLFAPGLSAYYLPNGTLTLNGNRDARDPGTDVAIGSSVARSSGSLLTVSNGGSQRLNLDYYGGLQIKGGYDVMSGGMYLGTGNATAVSIGKASTATSVSGRLQPPTPAGATQAGALFQGSGAPSNANGSNGDFYLRTDTPGTANQRLYVKSAGAWVGIL